MERPRPDQHKDFEVMVREFISLKYDPDYNGFTLFGRNGQRQYGCDIKDHAAKLIVQCKCYDNLKSGIYNKLFNAIKGDYEKARKHFNSMELFVVCTTLDNCSEITNRIKSLESMYEKQIPIHVYFWDSIEASINNSYTANKQYAEDFEKPLFLHKGNYRVCLRNLYVEQKYRDFSSEKQKKTKSESSSDLFQRIARFVHNDSDRLMIIEGDAGCGKTSLVQALCYIERNEAERANILLNGRPLVAIKLRDIDKSLISSDEGMIPAIIEYLGLSKLHRSEQIDEMNHRFPNAVLVLDGFDELCIIEGIEDYEMLLHNLVMERLEGWKIIVVTRPQYIHKTIDIASEFIAIEHFDRSKKEEWIENYTSSEKCNCTINEELIQFIKHNNDGVCDTPLTLYMIAGGGVNNADLDNLWLLYYSIFGREIIERRYDTRYHPGSRHASKAYELAERIAHSIYLTNNEKLYIDGSQLAEIARDTCNVSEKEIGTIIEHCLGLSCYWKISSERGVAEFYHNNIRDFFLSEMIYCSLDEIYKDNSLTNERKSESIMRFFRDNFRKSPLEQHVCEFLSLRSLYAKDKQLVDFPALEIQQKLLPLIFEKLIADGRSYNNFNEKLLLPSIENVLICAVQVYRSIQTPYNNESLLKWWEDNRAVHDALLFRIFYRRVWSTKGHIDFSYSDLSGFDFSNYNMQGVSFKGSNLSNAKFKGTNLEGANFEEAILCGADFENANLKGASLLNSDFTNAILKNTSFSYGIHGDVQIAQIEFMRRQHIKGINKLYTTE